MRNQNQAANPKGIIDIMGLIHFVMVLGLVGLGLFYYWVGDSWSFDLHNWDYKFPYLVPIASVLGIGLGFYLYNSHIKKARSLPNLGSKLSAFMTASLIRYACIEAPGFLALYAAHESGNAAYLGIIGILGLILIFLFPTASRAERDLELKNIEKQEFWKSVRGK